VVAAASTPAPAKAPAAAAADDGKAAEQAVRAWATAWSAKDMTAYLGAYAKDFDPPGKQSRTAWAEERTRKIKGKNSIAVKLENLTVDVHGSKAVARFRQDYRADSLAVSSRKTLDLVKAGDRWLIQRESTGS
jgi:ketosteroid isomerase-like protein